MGLLGGDSDTFVGVDLLFRSSRRFTLAHLGSIPAAQRLRPLYFRECGRRICLVLRSGRPSDGSGAGGGGDLYSQLGLAG